MLGTKHRINMDYDIISNFERLKITKKVKHNDVDFIMNDLILKINTLLNRLSILEQNISLLKMNIHIVTPLTKNCTYIS